MANATLTNPAFSLSQPKETNPKASRQVMPWEYDERRFEQDLADIELDPDKATPIPMDSKGSLSGFNVASEAFNMMSHALNAAPGLIGEVFGYLGKDLVVNQMLGLGEQPAGMTEKKPMTEVEIKAQNDAHEIKRITAWTQEIASNSFRKRQTDLMEQSLRITGGPITDDDVTKVGFSGGFSKEHLFNIATMGAVGEKRSEIVQIADQQEKNAAIPSPAKQANALETQFEGGSGKFGTGTASLSAVTATG